MAQTTRQTNLLVNQDWTKVYQSFTNADFTSYDFETLRNSMIDYLQTYYPETFNDFIESSEYLALIDMIAFLGQSLSFRTDLNARENFIDTAQRRDSILKLARMLSYNPTRTQSASGLIKVDNIRTTENVYDSNGINLSNTIIHWNDVTNTNWLEQFTSILNAALVSTQVVGKSANSQKINGIQTDEYTINLNPNTLPIAAFNILLNGSQTRFEAVSATTVGQSYIYEADPTRAGQFNILYRNDNNGNGSNNTGFFLYFKQGTLQASNFTIQNAIPNNFVRVSNNNINNTDSWLYSLNANGSVQTAWSQVPALSGVNVIYNQESNKNLYQINTLNNDQINLVFGDGSFANIPQGSFRFYYRSSNGLSYSVTPDDMTNISIAFNYIGATGAVETLTVTASLKYTVTNASAAESLNDIKTYAPQQYYTQNRMITGEDYNIFPLTTFTSIQKVQAINRISSGVSMYLDTLDSTGSFSSTNIFGDDGTITSNTSVDSATFTFATTTDIYSTIYNQIIPIINSTEMVNYYYATYPRYNPPTANIVLDLAGTGTSSSWGNITSNGTFTGTTTNTSSNITSVTNINSLFLGEVVTGTNVPSNSTITAIDMVSNVVTINNAATGTAAGTTFTHVKTTPLSINELGTANLQYIAPGASLQFIANSTSFYTSVTDTESNTTAYFGKVVPDGAVLNKIIPTFKNTLTDSLISTVANQIQSKVDFGLTYDQVNQIWANIPPTEIGVSTNWLLKFTYNSGLYNIQYRKLEYLFSSASETNFYFDPTVKIYDSTTGTSVQDTIKILKINTYPANSTPMGSDVTWDIYGVKAETDGYVDPKQVVVMMPDTQMTGVPDNPDLYVDVAGASTSRSSLYFQYKHNSPTRNRIDPTPTNLIDLYILTADYATSYIAWLQDLTNTLTEPTPPTSSSLELAYSDLNNYKAVSDTLIFNPAKFKPLFGSKAAPELQARFQVVKNPAISLTDNEVKSQVIAAINTYFDVANWDFGDTFYFSELAAYLHSTLAPNIASVLIVPADTSLVFGNYFQINSEPWEIISSAATVDNVDIISAVTAAQLNLGNTLVGTY